jgi:hypothetical protein
MGFVEDFFDLGRGAVAKGYGWIGCVYVMYI